jgi:DNA polymerase-3 subunit alpha
VKGGAFDNVDTGDRAMYFTPSGNFPTVLEHGIRFGNDYKEQKESSKNSLFGDISESIITIPSFPKYEEWNSRERLRMEKEVAGIYISGHPLDDYEFEIKTFTSASLAHFKLQPIGKPMKTAGIVADAYHGTNRRGDKYARFTLQDMAGSYDFSLRKDDYRKYEHLIQPGEVVFLEGVFKTWNNDNAYFSLTNLQLLSTVGEEKTHSIMVYLPISRLDQALLKRLNETIEESKGKHKLGITVFDVETNHRLKLKSKSTQVQADFNFIKKLKQMKLSYKVNEA